MTRRDMHFTLPRWAVLPRVQENPGEDVYLAWLSEDREALQRNGLLEKLQRDPARRPVDARFKL